MIPIRLDLTVQRGITFDQELIVQRKIFLYDPDKNKKPADLKRSHAENLDYYGHTYEYINCANDYIGAELVVIKPWRRAETGERTPLLILNIADGQLILTNKGLLINLPEAQSKDLPFSEGQYQLLLYTAGGETHRLAYGTFLVEGGA